MYQAFPNCLTTSLMIFLQTTCRRQGQKNQLDWLSGRTIPKNTLEYVNINLKNTFEPSSEHCIWQSGNQMRFKSQKG